MPINVHCIFLLMFHKAVLPGYRDNSQMRQFLSIMYTTIADIVELLYISVKSERGLSSLLIIQFPLLLFFFRLTSPFFFQASHIGTYSMHLLV